MSASRKPLLILIAILILTNLALLGILLFSGSNKPKPNRFEERKALMKERLEKEVGFNQQQLAQYDSLSETMYRGGKERMDAHRQYKRQVIKNWLASDMQDSTRDQLARTLGEKQTDLEREMLAHVKRVADLCTPAQRAVFDTVYAQQLFRKNPR